MKAAKSDLAKRLLADPEARAQIRQSATGQFVGTGKAANRPSVTVRDAQGVLRYSRGVVPKAA